MEISPIIMARLLLYCFLWGICVGVFYDVNRVIRVFLGIRYFSRSLPRLSALRLPMIKKGIRVRAPKRIGAFAYTVIFFGDLICVLLATLGILVLGYSYNYGEPRAFCVIGTAVGFLVYINTLGRLSRRLLEPIAIYIKYVILSFFIIIGIPFCKIGKIILKNLRKTVFLCTFTLEKRREKVYNVKEEVYLLKLAKNGFLKNKDR